MKLNNIAVLTAAALITVAVSVPPLFAQGDTLREGSGGRERGMRSEARGGGIDGMKEIHDVCRADLDKLCKDIKPGEGRFLKCLKENDASLSAACKAKLAEHREKAIKDHPCLADMEKFCQDVGPGKGQIKECMKAHEAEFSAACKAKMAEKKEAMMKKNPCAGDMEKFCKGMEPGEAGFRECMETHESEFTGECKAEIAGMKASIKKKQPVRWRYRKILQGC